MARARTAEVQRKTRETRIQVRFNLDGKGDTKISTPVPFLNHMLELFARHGLFDLKIKAAGDVEVDDHHTVEDVGICLGEALNKALGDRKGISRYGTAFVPMDEALARVVIDISGRPRLIIGPFFPRKKKAFRDFDPDLIKDFFQAFCDNARVTLRVEPQTGTGSIHHELEAIFKAFGKALDMATQVDPRMKGRIPSTKGKL